jgi:iron complex transport system substrate-binding protein
VRIVSLLPSATEIVFALGLGDQLEGVTYECDHPPRARDLPHVVGTVLPVDQGLTPAEIDAEVVARVQAGESIYSLDDARIRAIDPDLILTQDLCRVCALPSATVEEALDVIGCSATVLSLDPHRLDDVIESINRVGEVTGTEARARAVTSDIRRRLAAVRAAVADRPPVRVLGLEWSEPPYSAGHWVPDMIEAAGGVSLLADPGDRSRRLDWAEIGASRPDVTVFMPCGYDLDGAVEEAQPLLDRPELGSTAFFAVDANAYFSRPGPRVIDGIEVLAALLDPRRDDAPTGAARLR